MPFASREGRASATATLFGGCLVLAALFASGCGSSGLGSSDASCSSASPPQPPPTTDAGATSQEAIQAQWLTLLDHTLGRYMRGDILAYGGTMKGTATLPAWLAYYPTSVGAIAESTALASLDFFPGSPNDWVSMVPAPFVNGNEAILIVYSLADDQSMVFGQPESDPTITATSGIVLGATTNRLMATCSGCAPSFWARPAAISFDLTADGTVTWETSDGGTTSEAMNATASVQLAVVPPCNLTFDELKTLNVVAGPSDCPTTDLSLFVLTGGEWVYHAIGSVATNQPPAQGQCSGGVSYLNYTIDLYVNAANLADYGVRNYVLGATSVECPI
jgi:hypothetical protein